MRREADQPDIEVGAAVRARKLTNRRTGTTCRDFKRTWYSRAYVRLTTSKRK